MQSHCVSKAVGTLPASPGAASEHPSRHVIKPLVQCRLRAKAGHFLKRWGPSAIVRAAHEIIRSLLMLCLTQSWAWQQPACYTINIPGHYCMLRCLRLQPPCSPPLLLCCCWAAAQHLSLANLEPAVDCGFQLPPSRLPVAGAPLLGSQHCRGVPLRPHQTTPDQPWKWQATAVKTKQICWM